ncbi:MAG TPA: zinc ribbon domain-containing protein [Kiritimatiellia bacterium]|nr:zinc ribbon domain-containing protein [Kiritimatiellia bacterium]
MSPIVVCKQCGAENPLGRLFCGSCGAKLEMNEGSVRAGSGGSDRGVAGPGRLIRGVLFVCLLALLAALLIPTGAPGVAGGEQDAMALRQKLAGLRTAAVRGEFRQAQISEAEINGYLGAVLANQPGGPGGLSVQAQEVRVALEGEKVRVWLKGRLGPASLTYEVIGTGAIVPGGGFVFTPRAARLGQLPAPGPLQGRVVGQVAAFFSGMSQEQALLARLSRWEPDEQSVVVAVGSQP